MAFTGDLEHLPIADIIQLVHTTRKSGVFSIREDERESKIVFSSGYIVGANHINDRVRIGSVLVKTGAITIDDLRQALAVKKDPAKNRTPLMTILMQMGKLKQEDAQRGLRKLVEMTIVELMSWTKGTFTFDTDAVVVSSDDAEQDVMVDAQMVLMDAVRIFDERERDRANGKEVPSLEALYGDVLPEEGAGAEAERSALTGEAKEEPPAITADDLGLADIDRLEKKIPRSVAEMEIFDPVEIQRQKVKEILDGFSFEEQEAFVSFLKNSMNRRAAPDALAQQAGKAVVLYSSDRLISYSLLTMGGEEGVPAFATDNEADLERIVSQCLSASRMPVVVFDSPSSGDGFSEEQIAGLRSRVREKHPAVPLLQLASSPESTFILQSYNDGVRAVLPKPQKDVRRETYIRDTIRFLDTFKAFIKGFPSRLDDADGALKKLKEGIASLRRVTVPSDAALVVLTAVSATFERAVTLVVRASELIGERAVGIDSEKSAGPAPADRLKLSVSRPSVFRDAIEKGRAYYGESGDETLAELYKQIGKPVSRSVVLLPLTSNQKVVAVVYGDFGQKEPAPVRLDMLEVLAEQAGIVLEYTLFRRQAAKASPK